ncbi:hypothetical protein I4F81_009361 [Pyropia yezoensis]|uniref:Uncharacterized protein n=1 Tax=Pyropia yezoensis TaxID=2788 RepID=A0ACC3C9M4_PYRYE|nr:hypothetical protein I4F81_009361 [Neopyropia yezoensis]
MGCESGSQWVMSRAHNAYGLGAPAIEDLVHRARRLDGDSLGAVRFLRVCGRARAWTRHPMPLPIRSRSSFSSPVMSLSPPPSPPGHAVYPRSGGRAMVHRWRSMGGDPRQRGGWAGGGGERKERVWGLRGGGGGG